MSPIFCNQVIESEPTLSHRAWGFLVITLCDEFLLSGCNVVLSACENSSQWEMALTLFGGIQCDTARRRNSKHVCLVVGVMFFVHLDDDAG